MSEKLGHDGLPLDPNSEDFPDVGHDRNVYSGANVFSSNDNPDNRIPQEPDACSCGTEDAMDAVFSQPRRRG